MMQTEKLQILMRIVWSHFFTDKLIFIYIWPNLNIHWFIIIWICCQQIQMKSYSITFKYSYYSVSYLMSNKEGNFKLFAVTLLACISGFSQAQKYQKISAYFIASSQEKKFYNIRHKNWRNTHFMWNVCNY